MEVFVECRRRAELASEILTDFRTTPSAPATDGIGHRAIRPAGAPKPFIIYPPKRWAGLIRVSVAAFGCAANLWVSAVPC